jgi:hypothetical protein
VEGLEKITSMPERTIIYIKEGKTQLQIMQIIFWGLFGYAVGQLRAARLFLVQHTKTGKMFQKTIKKQMATKYTKWPQNIPNGHKIYQMATKYTKWPQNIPNGHSIYQMAVK